MIGKQNTNFGDCTINPMENCVKLPEVGNKIVCVIEYINVAREFRPYKRLSQYTVYPL